MILAENFEGLAIFLMGLPLACVALSLVSFFQSARGHWSGVAMAAPGLVIGALLTSALLLNIGTHVELLPIIVFMLPPALSILAIGLWWERRKAGGE